MHSTGTQVNVEVVEGETSSLTVVTTFKSSMHSAG